MSSKSGLSQKICFAYLFLCVVLCFLVMNDVCAELDYMESFFELTIKP